MHKIQYYTALLSIMLAFSAFGPAVSQAAISNSASVKGSVETKSGLSARCFSFDTDLSFGKRDSVGKGWVHELQVWLAEKGYLSATPTGYFGQLTKEAVRRFQHDAGLPETGYVGALTREAVRKRCSGEVTDKRGVRFAASPFSGVTPLDVSFNAKFAAPVSAADYYVDFGDGTQETLEGVLTACATDDDSCEEDAVREMSVSHTYEKAGAYAAVLHKLYRCPQGSECPALHSFEIASVTVTVLSSEARKDGITVGVQTVRPTYDPDEIVLIKITATNTTNKAKTLTWQSGCQTAYKIDDAFDSEDEIACTQSLTSRRIPAHSSRTWKIKHTPDLYELSEGTHTITGTVIGYGSATTTVEIKETD